MSKTPRPKNLSKHDHIDNCQNVEVYCRLKPRSSPKEEGSCLRMVDERTVECSSSLSRTGISRQTRYQFTRVLKEDIDQSDIFSEVALPLLQEFFSGKNALLFTYGVTGSGKTYTMQGNFQKPGLVPRTMDVLFNTVGKFQTKKCVVRPDSHNGFKIQSEADALMERLKIEMTHRQKNTKGEATSDYLVHEKIMIKNVNEDCLYTVFMSLVEVYNNSVYDLLQDLPESFNSTNKNPQNLTLREEGRRVYVHGAVEIEVKSSDEAVKLYLNGQRRRKVAETLLNTESSRSHCVLSLRLVRAPLYPSAELDTMKTKDSNADPAELVISQFSLVDLAGSERTGRTKNQGSRLKEASNINNSLMSLRMCIEILRENQTTGCNKVVPYRDQRLTYLFRNFFEGDGHVRILACINQSPNEIEETLNVLKFAESSQEVQTTRTPIQPPRSGTPVISRGHERVTNETDIETPKKNSNPCKIHAWNDVVPTELMQCEMAFPLPGTVLLPEDVNHLIQNQRSFLQSRINLKEKSSEIVRRQNDEFRSRLQALVQHDHKAHALHESRIQEALERERNKNSTLLTKLRQLETLLEEKNSAHRQEEADKKRQIDRLRYQIDQLRRVNPRPNPSNRAGSPLEGPGTDEGNSDQQKPPRTPAASHLRNKNIVSSLTRQWENRIVSKESGVRTPINARFTPGKKRRSRSADAIASILPTNKVVWIEHHDPKETPSGTLMTPKIKNRKSVTQLEYKDTLKATNYVLAHQKTDVDGNLQTELFKGDLIPTAGGGTACIFKDVEKLTQRSPLCMETETDSTTKRKRNSSAANTEEWDFLSLKDDCENDAPVSPDTITQRCRLSAGHRRSSNKKSRTALS